MDTMVLVLVVWTMESERQEFQLATRLKSFDLLTCRAERMVAGLADRERELSWAG